MSFTIIDIETTGLSKSYHKITEIAAAKVRNNKITKTYQTLVDPEVKIPRFITRLTGIDDDMVKDSPKIYEVLPDFQKFLSHDIFVAHNATFDYGFLNFNLDTHFNQTIPNNKLCTRKLANRILPELPRKRLADLCEYFNIKNKNAHRAMADVQATHQIFTNMLNILNKKGIKDTKDIIKFEKSPIKKR